MTFPPGLATIKVTGSDLSTFDGTPLSGAVIFTASEELADPAVSALLEGSAVAQVVNGVLVQPFIIPATNCVSPGFTYTITQRLATPDGVENEAAPVPGVAIPSTLGSSVDLSALL